MSELAAHDGGTIELEVVADASGLRRQLQREVKKAVKGIKAEIPVEWKGLKKLRKTLTSAVNAAAAGVKANISVDFDRAQVRKELEEATAGIGEDIRINLKATGSLADDVARESAKAEAAAEKDPIEVPIEPNQRAWKKKWGDWIANVRSRVKGDNDGTGGPLEVPVKPTLKGFQPKLRPLIFAALLSLLGPLANALGGVASGFTALASAIAPVTGLVGALPGLLGSLVATIVVGTVAVGGFTNAIGELSKAQIDLGSGAKLTAEQQEVLDNVLKDLPKSMAASVIEANKLTGKFQELRKTVQGNFFDQIVGRIEPLGARLIPALNAGLGQTASVMGRVTGQFLRYAASTEFTRDLPGIFRSINSTIGRSGLAMLDLFKATKDFMVASEPLLGRVNGWITSFGTWARESARVGRETGSIGRFQDEAADKAEQLGRILKSTWGGLAGIFRGTKAAGDDMLTRIEKGLDRFDKWANSSEGQAAIKDFAEKTLPTFYALAKLIGAIGKALGRLALKSDFAAELDKLRTDALPQLEKLFTKLSEEVAPKVIEIFVQLVRIAGELSDAAAPLGGVLSVVASGLKLIGDFFEDHESTASVIGTMAGSFVALSLALGLLNKLGLGKLTKLLGGVVTAGGSVLGMLTGNNGAKGKGGGKLAGIKEKIGLGGQQVYWSRPMPVYITGGAAGAGKGGAAGTGGTAGGVPGDGRKAGRSRRVVSAPRGDSFDDLLVGGGGDDKKARRGSTGSRGRAATGKGLLSKIGGLVNKVRQSGPGRTAAGKGAATKPTTNLTGLLKKQPTAAATAKGTAATTELAKNLGKGGTLGKIGGLLGKGGKLLKGGGILGTIAAIGGGAAGKRLAAGAAKNSGKARLGGAVSGAANGAATGALVGSIIPGVGTGIGAAVGGVVGAIRGSGMGPKIAAELAKVGGTAAKGLKGGLSTGFKATTDFVASMGGKIGGAAKGLGSSLKSKGSEMMTSFREAAGTRIKDLSTFVTGLPGRVQGWAKSLGSSTLASKGRQLISGLKDGLTSRISTVSSFVTGLPGRVQGWAKGIGSSTLVSNGRSLVRGLANGIKELASTIGDKVRGLGDKARDTAGKFKSLQGAGSRLGRSLGDGLASAGAYVWGKAKGLADIVKRFFPGSPVKEGPLTSWNNNAVGKRLAGMLADGLADGAPRVKVAAQKIASTLQSTDMSLGVARQATSLPTSRSSTRPELVDKGRPQVVFQDGAIQITNPAPEPASTSAASRLRTLGAFGLFE